MRIGEVDYTNVTEDFGYWTVQVDDIKDYLPNEKPHYLMGVGTPSDILGAVKRGIDMFDCVLPTRSGRTGLAFTWNGRINIKNNKLVLELMNKEALTVSTCLDLNSSFSNKRYPGN